MPSVQCTFEDRKYKIKESRGKALRIVGRDVDHKTEDHNVGDSDERSSDGIQYGMMVIVSKRLIGKGCRLHIITNP